MAKTEDNVSTPSSHGLSAAASQRREENAHWDRCYHDLYRLKLEYERKWLDQPRGLSAAEPPCGEGVINNPVDPTPGERGE